MYHFLIGFLCSFAFASSPPVVDNSSADQWYEWALVQMDQGDRQGAKQSLIRALSLDPELQSAKVQLGLVFLGEKDFDSAYYYLIQVKTCDPKGIEGLKEIGMKWAQDEKKQEDVAAIYTIINECEPLNADNLFYLGRALARTKQWDEAEKILKQCLELAPEYSDAQIQLGYVYLWEGRYLEAEEIFAQFPDNSDAKMGLALAVKRQGRTKEAKKHFEEILAVNPNHKEARKEKGRLHVLEMDYSAAQPEFEWLVDDEPANDSYWAELFDVKSHTRPALFIETLYTDAKEDDPSLMAPVVKDYYFLNAVHLLVPVTNRWRLDLKQIYYHQRENDIYPPIGVNYSMYLTGGEVISSFFFAPNWRWNVSARAYEAWGWQNNVGYPFQKTTRFEPGTGILYNSERQLFSVDAHSEAFVIKNFSNFTSSLLRTDYLTGGYGYRLDTKLKPEVEAWVSHIFIRDSLKNWENTERAIARCGVPFLSDYVTAIYEFQHGHFDQLSVNYYSFKQQLMNVLGGRLRIPLSSNITWESFFYHRWKTTYNLFQPIGNFIFVSPKQYLIANWFSSSITARYRDKIRLIVEGGYFYETLPYRDWHLTGSFLWEF